MGTGTVPRSVPVHVLMTLSLCAADKGVQRGQSQQVGVGLLGRYGSRGVSHAGPDGSLQRSGKLGAPGGPSHSGPG